MLVPVDIWTSQVRVSSGGWSVLTLVRACCRQLIVWYYVDFINIESSQVK